MDSTDGELLRRFVAERDESAFEELVHRHGRMVFGVCRRLLGTSHDAEDAFQATFMVLVRSAAKLRRSDSLASWLHGVALRIGLGARRQAAKRRERERRVAQMTEAGSEAVWRDLGPLLDEELGRLPERLRAPVVLCCVEGRSTEDAARELGWTHGALRGRLAKAKDKLRGRLSRRGVVIGAALLASVISENASAAAVPATCVASTVQAATVLSTGGALVWAGLSGKAAMLAAGALRGMLWAQIRTAAWAVAAGAGLFLGAVFLATGPSSQEEPARARSPEVPSTAAVAGRAETRGPSRGLPAAHETFSQAGPRHPFRAPTGGRAGRPEAREVRDARERPVATDLPEAVLQSLLAFRPDATVVGVKKRKTEGNQTVYKVDLEVGGKDIEVELGVEGTIRGAKEEIDFAEVPQAVAHALARLHPQATVKEAERETRAGRTTFEVELEVDGERFDVKFAPDGKVIEDEEVGDEGEFRGGERGDGVGPAAGAGPEVF